MKAILLDGSNLNDKTGERVRSALTETLQSKGWEVELIVLRDKKIGHCAGDFFCWVRTPGMCNVNDDNREISSAIVNSDLMIYLTPVTFGGYSSELKRIVDHQIQNISPFFAKVEGETHHQPRYTRYPDFLAIGWMDAPNPRAEAIFRHLAHRNAINFYALKSTYGLMFASQSEAELRTQAESWLESIKHGTNSLKSTLPETSLIPIKSAIVPRRAVLLVGSPRTTKSTSNSLGSYLMDKLAEGDVETEIIQVYTSLNSPEKMQLLFDKLDAADLAVLAFPLYVDNLPAPVIKLLERIAVHRAGHPTQTRFAAIANCGFPESAHNATALAICEEFSRQSGFSWAGSLSLGAGEGLVHGAKINELKGPASPIINALDLAAEALAKGEAIPQAAQGLMAKPFIPGWMYRLVGAFGWNAQAKSWGAEKLLRRKTYSNPK